QEGQEVWHRMLRAGIREFVTLPVEADHLRDEIRRVAKTLFDRRDFAAPAPAPEPQAPTHQILTVTGPRGGCGKTVVATNLAMAMARHCEKIALVDLNLWGGDV